MTDKQNTSVPINDPGQHPLARCLMQVLWPAFIGAAVTVGLVFSLIDPLQIDIVHELLNSSSELAYTVGFVMFWALYALTCSLTWYLATTDNRVKS